MLGKMFHLMYETNMTQRPDIQNMRQAMITNSGLNYFRVVFLKSFEQITSNLLKLTIEQRNMKGFFLPPKNERRGHLMYL